MEFEWFDGWDEQEHNGVGLVDISQIIATPNDYIGRSIFWNTTQP